MTVAAALMFEWLVDTPAVGLSRLLRIFGGCAYLAPEVAARAR